MRKTSRAVTVSVPATTANLGPGFDCLGLALDLRNEVTFVSGGPLLADEGQETEYQVTIDGLDREKVPAGRENLVISAAETIFSLAGVRPSRLDVRLFNRIPVASGLGSSSTAIVAGLVAANALVESGLSCHELLRIAVNMEGHPDNVAPAMLGGLVLGIQPDAQQGPSELLVYPMPPPNLMAIIVLPDYHFLTADARAALPTTLTRADAIFNTSRLGLLVHALTSGNFQQLRVAMGDRLHQTYRLHLIPGAFAAYDAAYKAGAAGVALSGAGPSLLALATGDEQAIARAMVDAFQSAGLASRVWILQPSSAGMDCSAA